MLFCKFFSNLQKLTIQYRIDQCSFIVLTIFFFSAKTVSLVYFTNAINQTFLKHAFSYIKSISNFKKSLMKKNPCVVHNVKKHEYSKICHFEKNFIT